MKLYETYSQSEMLDMLSGNPISFMKYLFNNTDSFRNEVSGIYTGYFLRSNNKTTSPFFDTYYKFKFPTDNRVMFRPYSVDEYGNETYDPKANVSDYIYIGDFEYIVVRQTPLNEAGYYKYNARWYLYDENYNFIVKLSNIFYSKQEFVSRYPNVKYFKIVYLYFVFVDQEDSIEGAYEPLSSAQINSNFDFYFEIFDVNYNSRDQYIGNYLRSKFISKWNSLYDSLAKIEPIDNINISDVHNGIDSHSSRTSFTSSIMDSGNDSLHFVNRADNYSRIYDGGSPDSEYKGLKEVTSKSENTEFVRKTDDQSYIFGFNSSVGSSSDKIITKGANLTSKDPDKNKDISETTGGYTDTVSKDGQEIYRVSRTKTDSGTDNKSIDTSSTMNSSKIGYDTHPMKNFKTYLDIIDRDNFYDIIFRDIDSIITLQIY